MAHWILIAGLALIVLGSEAAIRGGVGLSRVFGIPPLFTGVFVIAVATSAPELFVSLRAATMDASDIVLGGLIGTNILNILLVLGLGALIQPMVSAPKVVVRDVGAMLLAGLIVAFFLIGGGVARTAGIVLLALLALYVAVILITDWRRSEDHSVPVARALYRSQGEEPSALGALVVTVIGIVLLALGAHIVVLGSLALARELHLEETFVGLTVIALATSLPKLIVTLAAAVRRQTGIAVGQLIGANVFNLLGVLGVTALVSPLKAPSALATTDVWIMVVASAALLPLLAMGWRLTRPRGMLLMIAYGCYLAFVFWRQGLLHAALPWLV
jgi:cation:H+ antiporter